MKKTIIALLLSLVLLLSGCMVYVEEEPAVTSEEGLLVHYIDVGQADCILLESGDSFVLIDGGNREDGDLVVTYLEQQGVEDLAAVICSHAHEDHVGGLPSVLAVYPTHAVWAPTKTYSSKVFDKFVYYVDQQELEIVIPQPGDIMTFGDNVQLTVLGPVKSYADPNNTSIVVRVVYGDTSFLFTGDMEKEAETDMLDYWAGRAEWHADVLKMGHHGSDTSTGYHFLNEVFPTYAVISVGQDNDYGHPHKEPMERLHQAGVIALRTDQLGHIVAKSDGKTVEFTWENQNAAPEDVTPGESLFIGNKNSKTLHTSSCSNLPAEKNQVLFVSYNEAINAGYKPCSGCLG